MTPASGRLAQLVEHALDVRRVSGSSPLSSTRKRIPIHPGGDSFLRILGLEPIYMEVSGGHFLQPVHKPVAAFIFAPKGKNAYRGRYRHYIKAAFVPAKAAFYNAFLVI